MQLLESDPSDQVRLEAFGQLLEIKSSNAVALRVLLQRVLNLHSTVLQASARERLDELDVLQQVEAASR